MYPLHFSVQLVLAFIAGVITVLAYAPFSWAPLAILGPTLLLILWQTESPRRAACLGFFYGIGLFGIGTWWIYISIHEFGHLEAPLAILATVLVVSYEALFPTLQGFLLARWTPAGSSIRSLIFFPASWVFLEWVRSSLFTGWHWLILGYTQIDSPLGGYAPILGTYGISLLITYTVGLLVQAGWQLRPSDPQQNTRWHPLFNMILIAVIWINGALLSFYPFTHKNGKSVTVTMIQGNVPQELKWQPDQLQSIVEKYHKTTQQHWKSDLIIWPEGAIPALSTVAEPFLDALSQEAKSHNSSVILGIPVAEGKNFYNGMLMIGQFSGSYYKRHLVPFGEYVPLKVVLNPLISALNIPMSDFSSGPLKQPLMVIHDIPMAGFICYEIVEPDEVRRALKHAEMIVTITDDSWFDGSIASEQHLQMARMRSIENGLPQLFLSSRGASAIITSRGFIKYYLPEHKTGVITAKVFTIEGSTPWAKLGSWPVLLLSFLGLVFIRFGGTTPPRKA